MIWGRWFGQLPITESDEPDVLVETVVYRFLSDCPGRLSGVPAFVSGGVGVGGDE